MSLNIRQIRYFVAAAEAGKIVAAASAVGISPSAITEAIQDLEESVGTRLVTRHRSGIKVTYDGYVFLQHCRNVLSALSAATVAVGANRKRVEGELTIGVTITVAGYFLAAPLARFRRSFPDVKVSVRELDRSVIEKQLVAGQLGLGILLVSNLKHVEELATETLAKSRRRLWTATNHSLLGKGKVTLRDVAKEPYIQLTIDEAAKTTLSYWSKHKLAPQRGVPHGFGGGGAQPGGDRRRRHHPVRHGLPPVVAGRRQAGIARDQPAGPDHGCRPRLVQERRAAGAGARFHRVLPDGVPVGEPEVDDPVASGTTTRVGTHKLNEKLG